MRASLRRSRFTALLTTLILTATAFAVTMTPSAANATEVAYPPHPRSGWNYSMRATTNDTAVYAYFYGKINTAVDVFVCHDDDDYHSYGTFSEELNGVFRTQNDGDEYTVGRCNQLPEIQFDRNGSSSTWRLIAATNNGSTTVHIAYAYGSF